MKSQASSLSVNAFYRRGFCPFGLTTAMTDYLMNLIIKDTWVEGDEDVGYHSIPLWSRQLASEHKLCTSEIDRQNSFCRVVPHPYIDFIRKIINSQEFFAFRQVFSFEISYLDLWNGTESLDWHWDGVDVVNQCDALILIYLSDYQSWDEEWGGLLLAGERDLEDNFLTTPGRVNTLATICPVRGQCVLINNGNPRFVHKVIPLKEHRNRYTLTAGLKMRNGIAKSNYLQNK